MCGKCTGCYSEDHIFTHKLHCNSKFDDIGFLLTKDNMVNVLAREIEFMCAVLENDLAQENEKLRDGQVYRLQKGDGSIIVTVGK